MRHVSDDWMYSEVQMKLRFYNRNFVGTHFGGSLFSMTDMIYMLMLLHQIGRDHWIWDKSADIDFIKPGRGSVYAKFRLDQDHIDQIVNQTASKDKHFEPLQVEIRDSDDELIARVNRLLYVRWKTKQ